MKKILYSIIITSALSCTTTKPIEGDLMSKVIDSKTYDIPITAVINMDGTKSSIIPNTTMSNGDNIKVLNKKNDLDGEYYIRMRPNLVAVNLPYRGKSRSASLAYNSATDFKKNIGDTEYSYAVKDEKNGTKEISINLKEQKDGLRFIILKIDKNGTASIKASKINGQVAEYEGYIYN